MSSGPSYDPVIQQLQLLLTGYGYNFYNTAHQARADDLLVRERASYYLSQAVDMLATLRVEYQSRFIPPLTRANPDPPQEVMAQAREIEAGQQALSNLEAHIRGMAVPVFTVTTVTSHNHHRVPRVPTTATISIFLLSQPSQVTTIIIATDTRRHQ